MFKRFIESFPRLEVLDFDYNFEMTDMEEWETNPLRLLICTVPNLKSVRGIDIFIGSDPEFPEHFINKYDDQIKELYFENICPQSIDVLTNIPLKTIIAKEWDYKYGVFNDGLEKLAISSDLFITKPFSFVYMSPNLKSLDFTAHTHGHLSVLKHLKCLKELKVHILSSEPEKEGLALKTIAKHCPITSLNVWIDNHSDITPVLDSFASFDKLVRFELMTINHTSKEYVFKGLNSPSLQRITIHSSFVTKDFFSSFKYPNLLSINITRVHVVLNDSILATLHGHKHLTSIDICSSYGKRNVSKGIFSTLIAFNPGLSSATFKASIDTLFYLNLI